MSGLSFDPRPSNGGHHPNSKDCPLFFSLLFGDSFSQLHHLCLAIKAARHHFVALLYSKTCNWCSLLCLAAIECSLLDKAFVGWYSDFDGDAVRNCSTQRQRVRLCDLRAPSCLCLGNIDIQLWYIQSRLFFMLATLSYFPDPPGRTSTPSLVPYFLSVISSFSEKTEAWSRGSGVGQQKN